MLAIDAIINMTLGGLLVVLPRSVVDLIGVPLVESAFYPSLLGAVLFGIGIALLVERNSSGSTTTGLGLVVAVTINLCGGIVLAAWLLIGNVGLPLRGLVFLWLLVVLLLSLSGFELVAELRKEPTSQVVSAARA